MNFDGFGVEVIGVGDERGEYLIAGLRRALPLLRVLRGRSTRRRLVLKVDRAKGPDVRRLGVAPGLVQCAIRKSALRRKRTLQSGVP